MPRYRIVPEESSVAIAARSTLHPIHTRTTGLEGFVDLEERAARIALKVDRLRSGNPLQDRELRRRIDAGKHPTIEGVVTTMAATGTDDTYRVSGDVTFRGVTRTHEEEIAVHVEGTTVRIEGTGVFDIRDFGMQPPNILMFKVEPEVEVSIHVVAELER